MLRVVRIFSISGNNKGLACPFKPVLCQEGYCHDCQIYLDWQKVEEKMRRDPDFGWLVLLWGVCDECDEERSRKVKKETKGEG